MKSSPIHIASALLLLSGCTGKPSKPATEPVVSTAKSAAVTYGSIRDALTHEEAQVRQHEVARPSYTLWFGLDSRNEDYEGRAVISFDLKSRAKEYSRTLFLDFADGAIRSLKVNGNSLSPEAIANHYDGKRITFKLSELAQSANRIEIAFTHVFAQDGHGLYRFKDPHDGQVYVYTHFEPFGAHKAFPCFDQPDLKASFELTVEAPEHWKVISNMPERAASHVDGRMSWAFPPSPFIATYVFALHAGPFKEWKKVVEGTPFRLFARPSLAAYINPEDWFEPAIKGMDWYGVQFGYGYPYAKYDQVIVPELMAGAMENVAAVTFSERFVHRGMMTEDQKRALQNVILHELAHMWFGNLVTLKWWNSLWLNESFASFMAYKAQAEALEDKEAWTQFAAQGSPRALNDDQLATTHPVEAQVPDTEAANTVFDRISYGKGASAIRQLEAYLGEDDFKEGVQRYFLKHALRNATTGEFFSALAEASAKNLTPWQKLWIQSPGANTVRADWACNDGKISRFKLIQGNAEMSRDLRPHRTEIALYRKARSGQGAYFLAQSEGVTYSQAETEVPAFLNKPCPDFVFPNHRSLDFVKVELDPTSLATLKDGLSRFSDPMLRGMLWATLDGMRTDAKLAPLEYAELVFNHAPREKNARILRGILDSLSERGASSLSVLRTLPPEQRSPYLKRLETFAIKGLRSTPARSDLQRAWFELSLDSIDSVSTLEGVNWATQLLNAKGGHSPTFPGLKLDPDKRWEIIEALARAGAITQEKIDEELKTDPTDTALGSALSASLSLPDVDSKKKWLANALAVAGLAPHSGTDPSAKSYSWPKLRHALYSFHSVGQEDLSRATVATYFDLIPKLADPAYEDYAGGLASTLFPYLCDAEIAKRAQLALDTYGSKLPAGVVKALKSGKQNEERCIRARALSLSKPVS